MEISQFNAELMEIFLFLLISMKKANLDSLSLDLQMVTGTSKEEVWTIGLTLKEITSSNLAQTVMFH